MESASFTTQLGIDWKLLLSQVVNFALLLIILRFFVYKPILNMLKKRQEKIEEGLAKSEEADVRLKEVDNISKKRIKEVEKEAIGIIKNTEEKAKELENELLEKAKNKEIALFRLSILLEIKNYPKTLPCFIRIKHENTGAKTKEEFIIIQSNESNLKTYEIKLLKAIVNNDEKEIEKLSKPISSILFLISSNNTIFSSSI